MEGGREEEERGIGEEGDVRVRNAISYIYIRAPSLFLCPAIVLICVSTVTNGMTLVQQPGDVGWLSVPYSWCTG